MPSVVSTLRDTAWLFVRNFWYLVMIEMIFGLPNFWLDHLSRHPSKGSFFPVGSLIVQQVLFALVTASIFGLLQVGSGQPKLSAVLASIRTLTWPLFRLGLLLGIIILLLLVPLGLVMYAMSWTRHHVLTTVLIVIFLMLLKYALANPLVVVEGMTARMALQRSWEMTKGHFTYVFACYAVLTVAEWLIHRFRDDFIRMLPTDNLLWLPAEFVTHWVGYCGTILSWCMYWHIKAAETEPDIGMSNFSSGTSIETAN